MAFTFLKLDPKAIVPWSEFDSKKTYYESFGQSHLSAVFLVKQGLGLGYDKVIISFHPSYSAFDKFQFYVKEKMSVQILDLNAFLVNLEDEQNSLPFNFNLLANQILASESSKNPEVANQLK